VKNLIVGIAGTAKNTGKTTTMSSLLDEIKRVPGLSLGLTSIGFDGEDFDNVTGLPKPRIEVWPGTIAAIAERCRDICSAALEEIIRTDIVTPLGRVVIYRVAAPGKVVLAGANNRRELRKALDLMCDLADLIMVDGALNRIAPLVEADCLIFVTGAARFPEIDRLAEESRCIVEILSIPALEPRGRTAAAGSVLAQSGFDTFLEKCAAADSVNIQGVIAVQYLKELADLRGAGPKAPLKGKRLIFEDPIKLLLAGDAAQVRELLWELSAGSGIEIGVVKTCRLLAMTVNPYYPKYCYSRSDYEAAYVDSGRLLDSVGGRAGIPCYDVVQQGAEGLFRIIMDYWKSNGGEY